MYLVLGVPGLGRVPGPGGYLVQGGVPGLGGVPGPGGCTLSWGGVPGPRGVVYLVPGGGYLVLGGGACMVRCSLPVNRMNDRQV